MFMGSKGDDATKIEQQHKVLEMLGVGAIKTLLRETSAEVDPDKVAKLMRALLATDIQALDITRKGEPCMCSACNRDTSFLCITHGQGEQQQVLCVTCGVQIKEIPLDLKFQLIHVNPSKLFAWSFLIHKLPQMILVTTTATTKPTVEHVGKVLNTSAPTRVPFFNIEEQMEHARTKATVDKNDTEIILNALRSSAGHTEVSNNRACLKSLTSSIIDGSTNRMQLNRGPHIKDMDVKEDKDNQHVTPSEHQSNAPKPPVLGWVGVTSQHKRFIEDLTSHENPDPQQWIHILEYISQYVYLQTTLGCMPKGKIGEIIKQLWNKFTAGEWEDTSTQTALHSILLMLGRKGCGTAFHMDWSNAVNIAFAQSQKQINANKPLALWSLMDPMVMTDPILKETLNTWCTNNLDKYYSKDEARPGMAIFNQQVDKNPTNKMPQRPTLQLSDMVDINKCLIEAAKQNNLPNTDAYIIHIHQYHGQVVNVTVGWPHQVVNLEDCVKLAFDYATPEQATQCLHTNAIMHTQYKGVNPSDYRAILREAVLASRDM
jgi:hypothetical protein